MKVPLLILFLLVNHIGYASNIDSLKTVLNNTHGINDRAILMLQLGKEYLDTETGMGLSKFDSAILYAEGVLRAVKETGKNDTFRMTAFVIAGDGWNGKSALKKAMAYYDNALQYATRLNDKKRQSRYLMKKAFVFVEMNQFYLSIDLFKEATIVAETAKDKAFVADLYMYIADVYRRLEEPAMAFEALRQAMHISDSIKDMSRMVEKYMEAGRIFSQQQKVGEALKYFRTADSMARKKGDSTQIIKAMLNLGNCYKRLKNYDTAISMLECCIRYNKAHGKLFGEMNSYHNKGGAYAAKGSYAEAEKCFQIAARLNDSLVHHNNFGINNYMAMAETYMKAKQPDKALQSALIAAQKANNPNVNPSNQLDCILLLSNIYAAKGNYAEAYKYDKRYEKMQDSMFRKRQKERLAEAEIRFKLSEKNKALVVLSKENELHKVKSQKLLIILSLGGLLVIVGAGGYRRSIRNNAQLKKQKRIIDEQLTQLEVASEIKSKFYANISHELRTPVTLLTGMLEIMKGGGVQKEKLDVAYNNSRKLQSMIEEILNLSRLEKHTTELKKETIKVAPLLKRIVFAFESFIHKKGLTLDYSDENTKSTFIAIDEDKFEKIINNLVFNAIKFNKENGTIGIKAYLATDNNHVIIDVRDTGKGMNEKDLPHIFDRFYQASSSGKQAEGLGIGLSLVKEFTELLGGKVSVSSKHGEGSVFSLQFPVAEAPAQTVAVAEEPATLPAEAWEQFKDRQTVLVVEDNTEMRYYLKEVLGDKVNIAEAGNGKEALKWLEKKQPDLIISDIMMPEMNGHEFIANLKQSEAYKKIPIITLSALADSENQLGMLRMGVDDYMVKPFNADELRIRVYNLLHNYAERKDFVAQPAEPEDIKPDSTEAEEFRNKITEYVLARLKSEDLSVNELALELGLSERQLYRLAKSLTGCTPAQLIKEVRLQKAHELLLTGKIYKVEDVARRVGFEKASYFSLQFYERFGKRPSDFF